jgi:hypothetical protein
MPTRDRADVYSTARHRMRNQSFWVPGGRTVARLKLKGIDGRAPPGVEPAA